MTGPAATFACGAAVIPNDRFFLDRICTHMLASEGDTHAWWRYCLIVDPDVVPGGTDAVAANLKAWTVPAGPRYIRKPAFECGIFKEQKTLGSSRFPFSLARPEALDYSKERFAGTWAYLDRVLVLPWSERIDEHHVDHIATAIADAVRVAQEG